LEIVTFEQLHRDFPRLNPPVIDGLARLGEIINIIANSKFGKSWLVYAVLLCIIAGRRVFDRFSTLQGRCLLIDNELHPQTLSHRIPQVAAELGINFDEYQHLLDILPLRGNLCSLQDLAAGELAKIEPGTYRLIAFDAKYRFATPGVSENDNSAEALFYNLADQIAAQTGAAILFVHHSSKGSQTDKRVVDVGAGAGSQSRAADAHVILREHEEPGVAVLEAAVRSFAPVEPLALRWQFPLWTPDSTVDPAKLKGRLTQQQRQQTDKDREGVDHILTRLRQSPATARDLRERTGLSRERQDRLLDLLVSQGRIGSREITKKGNNCREYFIIEPNDS
jgi:hypothetical protein